MPIDPRIPLGVNVPEPIDVNAIRARNLTLDNAVMENRLNKIRNTVTTQELDDKKRYLEAWRNGANDEELYKISPTIHEARMTAKLAREKSQADIAKTNADTQKAQAEALKLKRGEIRSALFTLWKTPAEQRAQLFPQLRAQLIQQGHKPEELPEQLDEASLRFFALASLDEKDQQKILDDIAEAQRKADLHQPAVDKAKADAAQAGAKSEQTQLELTAQTVDAAQIKDQASYTAWRQKLKPEIQSRIPEQYSPSAVEIVKRMGMSAYQQVTSDRAAVPNTPAELAYAAVDPNLPPLERAKVALKNLQEHARASRPVIANANGLSNGQFNQTQVLSRQLDSTPIVKNYNETAVKAASVKAILDRGLGGPGDLAIVYEFMKGLDPTSVVRESEYETAAKSGNIFAGAWAKFNGYLKPQGGFLPPQVKSAFQSILNEKLNVSKRQVQSLYKDYARRIDVITGQPGTGSMYLTDYTGLLTDEAAPAAGGAPGKPEDLSKLSTDELMKRLRK